MSEEITRVSPEAYWRLKDEIQKAEINGYGPDDASRIAQTAIGLPPKAREIVIDYTLHGEVWPFMEKSENGKDHS